MSVSDEKLNKGTYTPRKHLNIPFAPAQSLTGQIIAPQQAKGGVIITSAAVFCRSITPALTCDVGLLPVASLCSPTLGITAAATMGIAATNTKFKLTAPILGIASFQDATTGMPKIVSKAITDNLVFSGAYTINVAAAAGQFWGAVRVQIDNAGVITTKVSAQDQNYSVEADALANVPPVDPQHINLGTIAVRSAAGVAFTFTVTALNAAGTTVHYAGAASGWFSTLTGPMTPLAQQFVTGVNKAIKSRRAAQPGALIIPTYTSDGNMVVADLSMAITVRPYPLSGEALIP